MATKTKTLTAWVLAAILLSLAVVAAGCLPMQPAGAPQQTDTSAELVITATPAPTSTPLPTRTPRSTRTPDSSLTPALTALPTQTRTPQPTATRWVVARLTATALAQTPIEGQPTPTPLSEEPGVREAPPLAGRLVLMRASGAEIYTIGADGADLRVLTHGLDPAWSPDGSQVALTRWDGPDSGLWVVNADGSAATMLFGRNLLKEAAWTPDGRAIVFATQTGGKEAQQVCFPPWGCFTISADPYWRLALVNVANRSYRDLSSDLHSHSPSLAAGSDAVIYAGDQGIQSTALTAVDERHIWAEGQISSPAISPDGTRIVHMTYLHDHWDLFMMTSEGRTSVRLTRTSALEPRMANYVAPAWSPDGKHIAYFSDRDGTWRLYVMNADGSGQRLFLADELADIEFAYDFAHERMVDWGS